MRLRGDDFVSLHHWFVGCVPQARTRLPMSNSRVRVGYATTYPYARNPPAAGFALRGRGRTGGILATLVFAALLVVSIHFRTPSQSIAISAVLPKGRSGCPDRPLLYVMGCSPAGAVIAYCAAGAGALASAGCAAGAPAGGRLPCLPCLSGRASLRSTLPSLALTSMS